MCCFVDVLIIHVAIQWQIPKFYGLIAGWLCLHMLSLCWLMRCQGVVSVLAIGCVKITLGTNFLYPHLSGFVGKTFLLLRYGSFLYSNLVLSYSVHHSLCILSMLQVIQKEGEGIVVLPNAAHTGGNLGTNLAEACNFGTKSWIPYGCVYPICSCM